MVYFVIVWVGEEYNRWHKEKLSSTTTTAPRVYKGKHHIVYVSTGSENFFKQRMNWEMRLLWDSLDHFWPIGRDKIGYAVEIYSQKSWKQVFSVLQAVTEVSQINCSISSICSLPCFFCVELMVFTSPAWDKPEARCIYTRHCTLLQLISVPLTFPSKLA